MTDLKQVFVYDSQHEFRSNKTTGFTFTIQYDGTETEAQIRLAIPLAASAPKEALTDELRRLAEALLKAAQSPEKILWQRPDPL